MEGLDPVSQGLFFSASQAIASQNASKTNAKSETKKTKRTFSSALEKSRIEHELLQEGFPLEIAEMEDEEAVVFLKDAADIAADKLRESQMPENFFAYKKAVSQFMRFLVKNNFEVVEKKRTAKNRRGQKLDPHKQVVIINEKLDEMGRWLLSSHKDTLGMLKRLEEINGMLVDLIAV